MREDCLKGKLAIVTGSRRGIGRSIAFALAGAGADLVVCDLIMNDGKLNEVAEEIKKMGRHSLALKVDVARRADVEEMVRRTVSQFGRIDILVNCAGVWIAGQTLLECNEDSWDKVINVNLKGTYLCCQVVGKIMLKQKSGNIINLSSQVGLNPSPGLGAYSISKAGIIMLTQQLALELAAYNIRVNVLAPGVVKTDFNRDLWKDPKMAKQIADSIPLGRLAEPDDIAGSVLFLTSDDSGYITGTVISIDGGWRPTAPPRGK
ncbi:MAG: SDR family oxidoreductase [Thermodesulfobacteriota bacterium]|jgi:NAD(P)-dependent dehydrogenase (short-subunit alcohol dehydrogenase family)